MKKKTSVSLIAALMLLFSFALTGCTLMDKADTKPTPSPSTPPTASPSPVVTPETTPDTTPEIKDDDMGVEDGVVKDEDGIITEGDTGSTNDDSIGEKAGKAMKRGMGN